MDERRRATRHALQLPIVLTDSGEDFPAHLVNLSTGGLMVDFGPREARVGQELELRFDMPGLEDSVTAGVVVRWVDSIRTELAGLEFTTGLRAAEVYAINALARAEAEVA